MTDNGLIAIAKAIRYLAKAIVIAGASRPSSGFEYAIQKGLENLGQD